MITIYRVIFVLALVTTVTLKQPDDATVKRVMEQYFKNIKDVDSKYVIDERLAESIARHFNGKINAFPLFKVSITLDKTPVKIPWTVELDPQNVPDMKKRYKYVKIRKPISD